MIRRRGYEASAARNARPAPATAATVASSIRITAGRSTGETLAPADPTGGAYPTIAHLAAGLAEQRWDREFEDGLAAMLDQIGRFRGDAVTNAT